ncbi:MAG TPA: tetratricopeptide repeat protein [Candidatus Krumholzibacteria bacterium]|nr:tetratricopeptide repeat protein [Candidatus Krumholzibacteria bacterium]
MGDAPVIPFLAGVAVALLVVGARWTVRRDQQSRRVERATDPYIEGLKLLVDGKKPEAMVRLHQAIMAGGAPADAYVRIGRMLRENGDASKALQVHKSLTVKADLTREEKVAVYANVAEDYAALGHPERALETVEVATRRTGLRDAELSAIAARACHALGRTEEAYEHMKELKKAGGTTDREIALYLVTVAEKESDKGRARDAKKTLARALRHDPECAPALVAMARLEEQADDVGDAIRLWRQAAQLSPDLAPVALRSLERALYQRGTFNEIESVYRDVLETRPNDEHAALGLASFYRKQGRMDDAMHLLEEYRGTNPATVAGTVLLSSLYAARGDTDELESFLDRSDRMLARDERYRCGSCGYEASEMRWHCPRCNRFDTFARTPR